jgi:hypothetical protein
MSPKSKKYRRAITPVVAAAAATGATQSNPVVKPALKNNSIVVPVHTTQSFLRDLTWIGLTTLIIVILMIVAYYVVPR